MSYAGAYALFNYHLADPAKGLVYPNMRLTRAFERGLDPKSSEAGFVLTHVDMVKDSGGLVGGALKVIDTIETGGERSRVNEGFREVLSAMERIEACMEGEFIPNYLTMSDLVDVVLIVGVQICGRILSPQNTSLSGCSSSGLPPSPCSPMGLFMRVCLITSR